jgi:uncharacterized MAPEG superfamily protein
LSRGLDSPNQLETAHDFGLFARVIPASFYAALSLASFSSCVKVVIGGLRSPFLKTPMLAPEYAFMTTELVLLAASVVLGIVHIILVSHLQSWQRGYRWTASSRDESVVPLTGAAGRAERALRNYLETFPFFAAAILVVAVTNTHGWLTVWGAHFYFWGRIVYAILYMADLPLARSLVWNVPTIGILMNVAGLFVK